MKALQDCFEANRAWADRMREKDPRFFERLVRAQSPDLLWIGCSDSRLPPDQIVGRLPGEIFVHRNVGNVVVRDRQGRAGVLLQIVDLGDPGRGAIFFGVDRIPTVATNFMAHTMWTIRHPKLGNPESGNGRDGKLAPAGSSITAIRYLPLARAFGAGI